MKNNLPVTSFKKYQISYRNLNNNGLLNNNFINDNLSFDTNRNFYNVTEPYQIRYSTIEPEGIQTKNTYSNYHSSQGKLGLSFNKENLFRSYYELPGYHQDDYQAYDYYDQHNNYNVKPYSQYSKSIEGKPVVTQKNIKNNIGEKKFPSNYSYYESKYSKTEYVPKTENNKRTNNYITQTPGNTKIINLNKGQHIITKKIGNNKYNLSNSPIMKKINNSNYYKTPKEQSKNLNNSNSGEFRKNTNTTFQHTYKIIDNKMIDNRPNVKNKNNAIITIVQQRTPSSFVFQKMQSPISRFEKNAQIQNFDNINEFSYNKSEINIPSKSFEKITIKKYQKNKNNDGKNIQLPEEKKAKEIAKLKINNEKMTRTPNQYKIKSFIKIKPNLSNYKNMTIAIPKQNDSKNNTKKNTQQYNKEHIKAQTELKLHNQVDNKEKNEEYLQKKNKTDEKVIKTLNSSYLAKSPTKSNDIWGANIVHSRTIEINYKHIPKIMNHVPSFKKYQRYDESDYMKEIADIMLDKNNEAKKQPTVSVNGNKTAKNKKNIFVPNRNTNLSYLSKGKTEPNNKSLRDTIRSNRKNLLQTDNSNDNTKKINTNTPNIKAFELEDKNKKQENEKSIKIIHINNKNKDNILKTSNSNKSINTEKNSDTNKTEYKKNVNLNDKKSVINTIPKNKLNQTEEKQTVKKDSSAQKTPKKPNQLLRHEARANETSKPPDKEDGHEEEWDNTQFKGMKKQTYDPGRRPRKSGKKTKKNLKNTLNEEFSATNYIKVSEGLSIAGKNEYGNKKTNQDTFIIEKNVNGILNFNIFGVLDGHGDDGHFASQFVSRFVVHRIKNHPLIKKLDEPKKIYNQLISNGYEIIANIYIDADIQIQKEKFNVTRSGTTIVLVIQLEEHIICANTGDSRAIAIFDENYEDNLVDSKIFPLSYDCKPELPNEMKRIISCGGVVEKTEYSDDDEDEEDEDDPLPYRVWAKGEDYPGLAMSRSIGDMDAKKVGVIPNPQIVEYTIDFFSKYMLLASDGIWEFISNEEAMRIGNKYYLRNDPKGLCHELTQKAIKLWEKKDVVIDDITIIVVFF